MSKHEMEIEKMDRESKEAISKACPNGECQDKTQCWEPCGDLGHSEEHCVAIKQQKYGR